MEPSYDINIRSKGGVDKYPAKAHAQCVADKLGQGKGLIILSGEKAEFYSNSDKPRPFRQDRYFYYLTGCNEPGCHVTYDIAQDTLTLWLPPINLDRVYYDGRGSTVEEALELYDVDDAQYLTKWKMARSNLSTYLCRKLLDDNSQCAVLRYPRALVPKKLYDIPEHSWNFGLQEAMDACRAVKDEHELRMIREGGAVTAEAHTNVLKRLHLMKSEQEVEAIFVATCFAHGAQQQSYRPICGAGPNASQLHYVGNNENFGDRQLLLIDAGSEWKCYASDVTRTMPLNSKKPGHWQSDEAKNVYKAVEKIQETCIKELRPGKKFIEVAWLAIHMAIDALLDLKILKGDHMDIFHAGTSLAFFPHGLGHHMGLEVHDVQPPGKMQHKRKQKRFANVQEAYAAFASQTSPSYTPKEISNGKGPRFFGMNPAFCLSPNTPNEPPLEPGMIVTVEPGLYFNKFVLDTFFLNNDKHTKFINKKVLERYMSVGGVRIEDDILITKSGCENLTTAPKGARMLEIIRESAEAAKGEGSIENFTEVSN